MHVAASCLYEFHFVWGTHGSSQHLAPVLAVTK